MTKRMFALLLCLVMCLSLLPAAAFAEASADGNVPDVPQEEFAAEQPEEAVSDEAAEGGNFSVSLPWEDVTYAYNASCAELGRVLVTHLGYVREVDIQTPYTDFTNEAGDTIPTVLKLCYGDSGYFTMGQDGNTADSGGSPVLYLELGSIHDDKIPVWPRLYPADSYWADGAKPGVYTATVNYTLTVTDTNGRNTTWQSSQTVTLNMPLKICPATFPDAKFRQIVSGSQIDKNQDGLLSDSEIAAVTSLDVGEYVTIASLQGIEYFTELRALYCYINKLSSLDLSGNPKLEYLDCSYNQLSSLDLSGNPKLDYLRCSSNQLSSLNLSGNPKLGHVSCSYNQLSSLDLSGNPKLRELSCSYNQLSSLDLSGNPLLEKLNCHHNPGLSRLNLYPAEALRRAVIEGEKTVYEEDGYVEYYLSAAGSLNVDPGTELITKPSAGWQQIGGKWYYYNADGTPKTGWVKSGGKWYYMDDAGVMQTGWVKVSGKWYYLNSSGVMLTGWQQIGGKWYYLNSSGVMLTGWQQIGGKWYYLNSSGVMLTGWQQIGGKWYYLNSSGVMLTGWQQIGGKWYYFESSGAMKTGWLKSGGSWYYLDSSGAMLANTSRKIGGKTYNFNASGVCTNP